MKEQNPAKPMGLGSIALIKQPASAKPSDWLKTLSNSASWCSNSRRNCLLQNRNIRLLVEELYNPGGWWIWLTIKILIFNPFKQKTNGSTVLSVLGRMQVNRQFTPNFFISDGEKKLSRRSLWCLINSASSSCRLGSNFETFLLNSRPQSCHYRGSELLASHTGLHLTDTHRPPPFK